MSVLSQLKIAHKLPALVIGGVVAVGLGLGISGVMIGSSVISQSETKKLETLADGRAHEMKAYLEDIQTDLVLTADNPYTVSALKAFDAAWDTLVGDQAKLLQDAYIDKNPNELGSKHLLDAAPGGTEYDKVHGQFHATFREQLNQRGYYDIFLFDDQGDLVYTVFKELDYATNFKTGGGEWADTDLGNAFRAGISLNKGESYFLDFKPYKPSYDAPASFISTPIFEGNKRIGVLVFQMPIDRINAIMGAKVGLGETGETVVVGADHLMRNDSTFSEENDILQTTFEAHEIDAAINGNAVQGEFSEYRNTTMLFAASPMEFKGTTWAVLAVQDKSEALASVGVMRMTMLAIGGVLLVIMAAIGWFFSRTITRPMSNITETMRSLSSDDLDVTVDGLERHDELGSMARAVEVFRENAVKVAELGVEEAARQKALAERQEMMEELQQSFGIVVGAAAAGDFSQRVSEDISDEEMVKLSRSVNSLIDTVDRGIKETGEVLAALANTDLTKRMEGNYDGAFLQLKNDTNRVADRLTDVVGQLRSTSTALKNATSEILAGANDLSERTTRQAATIEETSAAMEQLADTVLENAKEADNASEIADKVRITAEEGGDVMRQANEAMERITESSNKISNIIGMIDDIAFQTNLLALNASVEAARAGEAGKGFAVVAVEVRRLAQSAATASSDVKVLIEQSVSEVDGGTKLVSQASENLGTMLEAARANNELMVSIADKSKSQASSIEQINTAVREMDETTQHNAALVEETNAAIEQTESQAAELDRIVDVFVTQNGGQRRLPVGANNEVPKELPPENGIKDIQKRAATAAKSYLSHGNAAVDVSADDEWQQF
ncbi:methyl-accepting chemotaxis protein [Maritalea porphyrae]|uniref:Methyl-accepting chemotaxis protein n=1 Tax=Maritalea porphyrae TaxID=880732 RepID=A0ABQ5UN90_9HYPH|nr:methyl-accepting chemotaxis protein [Maritalea porphyrae]GLQ16632.1 hypothetical protein GCM10007879_08810 [Maritalea porphyrae]